MTFRQLQDEQREWLKHNFPEAEPWEALVGLQEEVGELAHAHLKGFNSIRRMLGMEVTLKKIDAVGDILVYLASYCNTNGIDMQEAIEATWAEVKARDWRVNKEDGRVVGTPKISAPEA